jgi:hypothetical protein
MTDVILDFAGPMLQGVTDREHYEATISFVVLIWNAALLPEARQGAVLHQIRTRLATGPDPHTNAALQAEVMECFEERKRRFPRDRRFISHYQVRWTTTGPKLEITTADKPPPETP